MRLWIKDLANSDFSSVRGIGSYVQMLIEAINSSNINSKNKLILDKKNYDILIHPGFSPYEILNPVPNKLNILVIHDLILLKYPEYFPAGLKGKAIWLLNQLKLKQFANFITDTKTVKKELKTMLKINSSLIKVVYPATKIIFRQTKNKNNFNIIKKLPKDFVLYTGDITWNKNLVRLAKAIQLLNLNLVLVGKALVDKSNLNHPWKREFKQFLEITKKDKRFTFLGYLSDTDLKLVYQKARVLVLPSLEEGFGLTWLEAAQLKVPTVVSNIPVLKEVTQGACRFINPLSISSIVSGIEDTYYQNNENLIKAQSKRSTLFSQTYFIEQLSTILYNLVNDN